MNFLQLAQRVRQESDMTASSASSPTTVVSQTGKLLAIVNWTAEAYNEIQRESTDWRWLRSRFTLSITSGDDTYAYTDATDEVASSAITRFQRWIPLDEYGDSNLSFYLAATGVSAEQYLTYLDWASFRARYKFGTQTNAKPVYFTISPANELMFGPKPDATYTVRGEYQKSSQALALDADTPEMPADYHMLVVWHALKAYASFAAAPEVWTRADEAARPLKTSLHRSQLPAFHFGGPLA